MKKLMILGFFALILSVTTILAYNGYGSFSPADFLENEWFVFGAIFCVFFAMIYFGLQKSFPDNKGIPGIIAGIVSFFMAATLSKKFQFGLLGEWGVIIMFIIVVFFIIKIAKDSDLGGLGLVGGISAVIFILILIEYDPYNIIPNQLYGLYEVYGFLILAYPNKYIFLGLLIFLMIMFYFSQKDGGGRERRHLRSY